MPRTPDASDGPLEEEAIDWLEQSSDPSLDKRLQFVQDDGLKIFQDGVSRPVGASGRAEPWQYPVISKSLTAPPGGESAGDRYIVGDSATGVWSGHDGEIAQYTGSGWVFSTPEKGFSVHVKAQNSVYVQTASSTPWVWKTSLTETQHEALRQLIHFIDEGPGSGFASGAYKETTPTGPFPTSVIWWESSSKLKKIVERTVTWTGSNPTTDQWKVYDTDGVTVLATVTDSISYTGPFETTRTRTIV